MQVIDMLRRNGEVSEYTENEYVTRIFFSTYEQVQLYNKYPEVVCIDSIYNTNNKKVITLFVKFYFVDIRYSS